jgi:hypothetical protein
MKHFQNIIRALILAGSVSGFLGGWALFAHAGKPVDAAMPAEPVPAIAPAQLPPLNFNASPNLQPLPSLPRSGFSMPRMRTRGS